MAHLRTPPPPPPPIPLGGPPLRYGPFDQIVIDRVEYTCISMVRGFVTLARVDNPNATQTLSREDLNVVRFGRGFRHNRDFYNPEAARARKHASVAYVTDLSDEEQKEILWKEKWCLAALRRKHLDRAHPEKISFTDDSLLIAIPLIAKEIGKLEKIVAQHGKRKRAGQMTVIIEGPGPKCLRDWCAALKAGGMNPLALRNQLRKSGHREPRLKPEEYAFLLRFARLAATPEKQKPASLHRQMSAAMCEENKQRKAVNRPQLNVPSEKRLREEISEISKYDMMAGQMGTDIARNYFRAITTGLSDVSRPLERVEYDEWDVHLHVLAIMTGVWDTWSDAQKAAALKVRLVLCIALDVVTRCVVGMSIARTACSENAVRCLEMAVSDKQPYADAVGATTPWDMHGTHETSVADAGSSFANHDFHAKNVDLGTKFKTTVAGLPWLRACIERIFRSIDDKFVSLFAGRTFGNVVEKGEYDSEGNACLTIDEFAEALVRYKIDHYHNCPHEGLGGETPRAAWLRLTEELGVDPPPDENLRRVVFGHKLSPMLGAHGLCVLGIDYQSIELNELFKQAGHIKVDVRVDLHNLGAISARIAGEWETIDGAPELFRVTADDWIAVWDELQARNAIVNSITRAILDDTMTHLVEIGRIARKRRNIAEGPMDAETLVYHQKRMNIGVRFAKDLIAAQASKPVDLFDGVLVVGGNGAETGRTGEDDAPTGTASSDRASRQGAPAQRRNPGNATPKDRGARWKFED
jgi:putative transposase